MITPRLLLATLLSTAAFAAEPPLAFPTAEGGGRFAAGGRGGDVVFVTNLDDSGPGSLRDAVSAGNRTVVFRVSGTIELKSELIVRHSNLTIAGQTAPGDGIALRKYPLRIQNAKDVIVRFLRVRPGDEGGRNMDGIEIRTSERVMIDHCSVSWTLDEGINSWHGVKHATFQWCLISEALNRGGHAFAASLGGEDCSYHHNLLAHCTGRNASVAGNAQHRTRNMDYRNNVVYNWEHRTIDGKPDSINVVNNYYKPGPATELKRRIVKIDDAKRGYGFDPVWFIAGNVLEGAPDLSADNWKGGVEFEGNTNEKENRARTPFPFAPVATQSAEEAYKLVLAKVGARKPKLDAHDTRVLRDVETGTATIGNGIVNSQKQTPGWPELKSTPAPADADNDGMPDAWEKANGLNPNDPADRNQVAAGGYTRLERYLAELAGDQK